LRLQLSSHGRPSLLISRLGFRRRPLLFELGLISGQAQGCRGECLWCGRGESAGQLEVAATLEETLLAEGRYSNCAEWQVGRHCGGCRSTDVRDVVAVGSKV
jgi:hypothetical protein